ncbi:MAG: esterase [Burkholderiales bacterium PBB6]|nr:MAG: esterase [Burkholderiales bacterium PBB6]
MAAAPLPPQPPPRVSSPAPMSHLLYLHGFRSSPLSTKAQHVGRWLAQHRPDVHVWCPQLPPSPAEAMALVLNGIAHWPLANMAVVGSSLGGFYASVVHQRTGCRAVLLNPAVQPARDLARHIGEQHTWQDPTQAFFFQPGYIDELLALSPATLTAPERCAAVIAKGDEVLDWHEMSAHCQGAQVLLLEGSDHALSDFDQPFSFLLDFLQLQPCD